MTRLRGVSMPLATEWPTSLILKRSNSMESIVDIHVVDQAINDDDVDNTIVELKDSSSRVKSSPDGSACIVQEEKVESEPWS
mmetsp:Transcript_18446/g.34459  ORF Transcript_18446/g.34459 Transcript_18446/m.34459 type:complete len:82 (-) Transcript_18446:451-696(-)